MSFSSARQSPRQGIYPHHIKFTEAMNGSEFCYSPLGTHGGDPGKSKVQSELERILDLCCVWIWLLLDLCCVWIGLRLDLCCVWIGIGTPAAWP